MALAAAHSSPAFVPSARPSIDLRLGDCLELMRDIPDESVNMILCDLPYGTTANAWDTRLPFESLWEQYRRIITPRGAIVLTAQMPFTALLALSNPRWLRYEWVWLKESGTGHLNANRAPLKRHENILVFSKGTPPYYPQYTSGTPYTNRGGTRRSSNYGAHTPSARVNQGRRCPTTDLLFPRDPDRIHPTQKPVALFAYLIRTYTLPGALVLDNCSGVATTAIACLREARRSICIEKDPHYYDLGRARVRSWCDAHPTDLAGQVVDSRSSAVGGGRSAQGP